MSISGGDLLLLGCAAAFAVQILFVDHFAPTVDPLRLNCLQAGLCGVGSAIFMLFAETPTVEGIWASLLPMCHAGFLSMGIAYSLQIIGQKHLEPAPASLIMSLESVFAAVFGWLFLQEQMSSSELFGCVLIFVAVILSQVPIKVKEKKAT